MQGWFRRTVPLLILLASLAPPARGETRVGGILTRDTRWTRAESPYLVARDVIVRKGVTLTIEPGVSVLFAKNVDDKRGEMIGDAELLVHGRLVAVGTAADSIEFTVKAKTPTRGDWGGILFRGAGTGEIAFANIRWSVYGIDCLGTAPSIHDVKVIRTYSHGLWFRNAEATVEKVFVEGVGHGGDRAYGIFINGPAPVTLRNSIVIGCEIGVSIMQGSPSVLTANTVTLCREVGVLVKNSHVTMTGNTLTENAVGLSLSFGAKGSIHRNNLYSNGRFDVYLAFYKPPSLELDLSENWWGVKSVPFVEERIWDGNDDGTIAATVKTHPILEGPVGEP